MAWSGRGRGRAAFTFDIEALGFPKGAALPDATREPPPTFPSTDNKPAPLKKGEDEDYMLALKQDLRRTMEKLPYFLTVEEDHEVIERYRKKYQDTEKRRAAWTPDWRRLPREIKLKKKTRKGAAKPKRAKSSKAKSNPYVLKKIEEFEKQDDEEEKYDNEEEKSDDEKDKTKDYEDDEEELEESDEEEHEEENDYISSYFEDGDDFSDVSDDNTDEATY